MTSVPWFSSTTHALLMLGLLAMIVGATLLWWRQRRHSARLLARLAEVNTQLGAAQRDPATGLTSRAEFEAALDEAVLRADQQRQPFSVLFVDIDDFGALNDTIGHVAGDTLLHQVALRIHRTVPSALAAARLGGDQTVLVLAGNTDAARVMAQRLLQAFSEPFPAVLDRPVTLGASIGIASYPQHGARALLLTHASSAMRAVKQSGGGAHAVFDPKTVVDRQEQSQMAAELRQAITLNQFELFYQPKVDARSLQITAAEALLRWRHPVRGLVSPAVFIPLAERHGLIGAIGNWVIEDACRQAGLWRGEGLRMRVAINLSAYQMRQDDVVDRMKAALRAHQLQPDRFTVEITESLALEDTRATQRTFEGLREAGVHVAIDDFGAGQTSLAYLRRLPASELKMDMSLVQDLETSADARAIAEAVIRLAHALERRVVAEGVETAGQRDLLVRMGCDELQGFLFARPMSATALGLWAMDDRPDGADSPEFRNSLFTETAPMPLAD